MKKLYVKPLDFILLLLSISAVTFAFIAASKKNGGEPELIIRTPKDEYVYPLKKDARYAVEGLIGISVIEVKDGKAQFLDSPCPNKTCVHSSAVSRNGEWSACLPNNVFIRIEDEDSQADAIAY